MLLLFFLWGISASSQSWQDLYQQTNDCWGKDWEACEKILQSALIAAKQEFGKKDSAYILTVNDLGLVYKELGQYKKGQPLLEEALELAEEFYGKEHPNYGVYLNNLGLLLDDKGDYQASLPLLMEAFQHADKFLGKDHVSYSRRLNNLALLYQDMGQFEQALPLLQESLTLTESAVGKEHPTYSIRLNNLGLLYQNMSLYEQALPYLEEALSRTASSLGKKHPAYSIRLNNLGILHESMSNYELALPLFQEALSIIEESFGKGHVLYANRLTNLGLLYKTIGNHELALQFLEEARHLTEQNFGKENPQYGKTLNNLASIYQELGDYERALPLLEESVRITEKTLGKDHSFYVTRLGNLGVLYKSMENYDRALPVLEEALRRAESVFGPQHPSYANHLSNLGSLLMERFKTEDALPLLEEALELTRTSLGRQHRSYSYKLSNVAGGYQALGQSQKAIPLFQEMLSVMRDQIQEQLITLDDRNQTSFLQTKQDQFNHLSSFLLELKDNSSLQGLGYDLQLLLKGFLQNNRSALLQTLRQHPDTAVQDLFSQWESIHQILARQYQKPISERLDAFDSLTHLADNLERSLANRSLEFQTARKQTRWTDIQKHLKPGEAAIEFAYFPLILKAHRTDTVMYVAYVLTAETEFPTLVPLFFESTLKDLFSSESLQENLTHMYTARGIRAKDKHLNYQNLTQVLWTPLADHLSGIRKIYYAPTGLLHRINFDAIPLSKRQLLSDQFTLVRLGSTRQLDWDQRSDEGLHQKDALLMGGVQYDSELPEQIVIRSDTDRYMLSLDQIPILSRAGREEWQFLPGTDTEIKEIHQVLSKGGYAVQSKTGLKASEDFLGESKSTRILHLATHGYFFPDPKSEDQRTLPQEEKLPSVQLSDHPMIRSGLILAGANHAWQGNPVPEGEEDGILTAYEISRMDLSNTELVVLSACETGLGDIQGNEGVYGLQRAFKIAGAKYILMSLWQVPDQATQELMTAFYEKWLGGMEIRNALQEAQKQIQKKYKEPYYWAGFVLVE